MIDIYKKWYETRHEYARQWKTKTGGKVLGYFCTYAPEEILYAAGVLPVRILGSHEPPRLTEPHIFGMYCPFCRDCLEQGLLGRYAYLDGIMIAQSCLHIRQAFTSWDLHVPVEFKYFLPMPHNVASPHAVAFLRSEYEQFIQNIEQWTGKKIYDTDLVRGIGIMGQNRSLMKRVYEERKLDDVPITGLETMYMVVSSQIVDKTEHSSITDSLLSTLRGRSRGKRHAVRLMVLGSEDDDTEFISMVEDLDAVVVQDDHCTGTRYFWDEAPEGADPLSRIARRYVDRLPCPAKDWPGRRRVERILDFAREWRVAGAIIIQQKNCSPHEFDIPAVSKALYAAGVKVLIVESDVIVPKGQMKTRVDAFLEMLSGEDLF